MLQIIAKKKNHFYTAKWISADDRNNCAYFRFAIVTDDNLMDKDINNMGGTSGTAIWETKSAINFQPDDILLFRGDRFNVQIVDGNRKENENTERAYILFNKTGNLTTRLTVRKAG